MPFRHEGAEPISVETQTTRVDRPGTKAVGIVGGGPAGLRAALALRATGHDVELFEAEARVGGRVLTIRRGDQSVEGGAMRVPEHHRATCLGFGYLGQPTRTFVNRNLLAYYRMRGVQSQIQDWSRQRSPFAFGEDEYVHDDPDEMFRHIMRLLAATITDADSMAAHDADLGGSPLLHDLSGKSLREAFLALGYSEEVISYMGYGTAMRAYEQYNALEAVLEYREAFASRRMLEPCNGMDALTEGLADRIGRDRIHLNCRVTGVEITATGDGVMLTWSSPAGTRSRIFDFSIIAVPAPAVSTLHFLPELPAQQRNAIKEVTYAPASKSLVYCTRRFWEQGQDGFAGGISYVEGDQIVYPSDNAEPADEQTQVAPDIAPERPAPDDVSETRPVIYRPRRHRIARGPGFLVVYRWGTSARRHFDLSEAERTQSTLQTIRSVHGHVDDYVELVQHVQWPHAFRHDMPGEFRRNEGLLHQPFPARSPRVWFAGEHLGHPHGWINAALESGAAAARAVQAAAAPDAVSKVRNDRGQ